MASVLYIMYGMPSCYNSGFVLARRFAKCGIDITLACDQDLGALAETADINFRYLKSLSKQETYQCYREITQQVKARQPLRMLQFLQSVRKRVALRKKSLADDELLQLIAEINPDLLLIDIECHLAMIASSTLSIPTAACTRLFDHRPGPGRPPLHSNLQPSLNFYNGVLIQMHWWKLNLQSFFIAKKQHFSRHRLRPVHYQSISMTDLKAIARRYGVNLWSIATTKHWFRPVTYTHLPILSMTLECLDFDHPKDNDFIYLGPMIDKTDNTFSHCQKDLARVNQFISNAKSDNRPIVYCSMGTYAARDPRFVEILSELAIKRPEMLFIMSLGGRESVNDYGEFPANALAVNAAPQLYCLANADAAILHAGIASLQEALACKVPVMLFSVDSMDQNGTATRWARLQLAIRFSLESITSAELGCKLDQLLADDNLSNRIAAYSRKIERCSKQFNPIELVNRLCA